MIETGEVRRHFLPTEAVALGMVIEAQERPAADARRLSGQHSGKQPGFEPESNPKSRRKKKVAAIAAKAVGMGETSYREAKQVVEAAEENPEDFGDLPTQMDETGNVRGAFREMELR